MYGRQQFEGNVDCSRILTGDQIVVQIASTSATLLVYEVEVYRKLFPSEVYSKHRKLMEGASLSARSRILSFKYSTKDLIQFVNLKLK